MTISRWAVLTCGLLLASVATAETLRIGVLAFRSFEQTQARWQPVADYLTKRVPGTRFVVEPILVGNVETIVAARKIDFLLANPEQYVAIAAQYKMAAIATLVPLAGSRPVSEFGGVIFSRADRSDINRLEDIAGRTVATASEKSFAGYLIQRWELVKRGLDIGRARQLLETGMPQDRVVQAVIEGQADIGFVRTGLIESMIREGSLASDALKVIAGDGIAPFSQRLSTDLYPEWPFAALHHVAPEKIKATALALLQLPATSRAASQARIHGFAPPGDYASVEALLLRLRMHPERLNLFGPGEVFRKYAAQLILGLLILALAAIAALVHARRQNREIAATLAEVRRLEQREELLDGLSEGVFGLDATGLCTFANEAATRLLGYQADELIGRDQHFMFHHHYPDGRPYPAAECPIRRTVTDGERRNGEEAFFRKDGSSFPVRFSVRAILRDGVISGAVVAFQDISEEKLAQQRLQELALSDPLTGLPNRQHLWERATLELARSARDGSMVAVLFIDLDGFKEINDRHGHEVGDAVLLTIAERLRESVRRVDVVSRLGGDEFVVVLTGLRTIEPASEVSAKLIKAFARPVGAGPVRIDGMAASIGIAFYPQHGADVSTLISRADGAMYEAKRAGSGLARVAGEAAAD